MFGIGQSRLNDLVLLRQNQNFGYDVTPRLLASVQNNLVTRFKGPQSVKHGQSFGLVASGQSRVARLTKGG